ncbi:enoyl-CoA hydratase-related protein [Sporichthya polymorpha]|uniref:enoyl-CoA hydratase-related protein n=1 Tax=Sporichthya polymorpha TaxID=35751 RepID=UPI00037D7FDA|nr:enoyl-CoA hydratase-related protein [Sporichthya polymorpha]
MSAESTVITEDVGAVRVVTLNRPEFLNALDMPTVAQLGRALCAADDDGAVRAIVLTAAGGRAFCVGMDLKAFAADPQSFQQPQPEFERFQRGRLGTPVIGAAQGTAVGGGLELLLACDLIVLADHVKLGLPEVKRGLFAAGGGTRISTRVPLALAMELALTGDFILAPRAYEMGLANRVVPVGELRDCALGLAGAIARNAPLALATTKRLVLDAPSLSRDEAWAEIAAAQATIFASRDAAEGAAAFAAGRDPVWSGS